MIYDLKNESAEVIPHFKGGDGSFIAKIHSDGVNKIIHGTLPPQSTIGRHTHEEDSEIIFILSGHGSVLDDELPAGPQPQPDQRQHRGAGVLRRRAESLSAPQAFTKQHVKSALPSRTATEIT